MAEQIKAAESIAGQPKLAEELKKMEYEPLLPVEKKLIGWSIGLGVGLLFILYWISATFFPSGH
ncbi:MAG: hypothetical protein M1510_14020 [Nitrospirae bacterium]|nr:hypothetical protein [Nitrospirota bacterium]